MFHSFGVDWNGTLPIPTFKYRILPPIPGCLFVPRPRLQPLQSFERGLMVRVRWPNGSCPKTSCQGGLTPSNLARSNFLMHAGSLILCANGGPVLGGHLLATNEAFLFRVPCPMQTSLAGGHLRAAETCLIRKSSRPRIPA